MSARKQRYDATRTKILKAALALIDKDGVNKFSLRAVARKVKYSPAGLYEYFDNKDDIVTTLCQIADDKLASYLSSVSTEHPYEVYMVEMGLAYIQFACEETTYFRLSLGAETGTVGDTPPKDGAYGILLNGVQIGVEQGYFVAQEAFGVQEIAYTLWSIVHGMAVLQTTALENFPANFQETDREALRRVLLGLKQS